MICCSDLPARTPCGTFEVPYNLCDILAWCAVCAVHPPASVRDHIIVYSYSYIYVYIGVPSPSCLVFRPLVVAPPADRFCFCPGATPCACTCFACVRPCAQGRYGQCSPGSSMMSDLFSVFPPFFPMHLAHHGTHVPLSFSFESIAVVLHSVLADDFQSCQIPGGTI